MFGGLVSGFDKLIGDLRADSIFADKIANLRSEDLKVDVLLHKLLGQGGPLSFFSQKLSIDERNRYVSMLKIHQDFINAALKSYVMTQPTDDFSAYFWFKNGKKDASEFDASLFRELITLDLPNINFNQYQTSRGTTVQSMINKLYTLSKQGKINKDNPLWRFLWNYLRKEITYCETLHDMMSSLPTHPAITEVKQALRPHDGVDLPVVIDKLLQGQLTTEELKLYYPLLVQQREVIDPIIKKYLWAARSSKKQFPWYTGFMNQFWFANKGKYSSRFGEEHSAGGSNGALDRALAATLSIAVGEHKVTDFPQVMKAYDRFGCDYDLRAFWKIIEHGLTAKDFADIATVDNVHVREVIALMYGKYKVCPFANGYAMIASHDQNYSGFHPTAIGFIDTNFQLVTECSYVGAKNIQPDGTVEVAINGEYVEGPGDKPGYYQLHRSTISLKKESVVKQ